MEDRDQYGRRTNAGASIGNYSSIALGEPRRHRRREKASLSAIPTVVDRIYTARGVDPDLARKVAGQLMAKDALGAHAHDELGLSATTTAWPIQRRP